ncbi:carboxypeptidase-like regulatory domain-containing protein [Echinicola jeungdonensis]|uniref:TonB-dependent receptor n=1 Tax=Echinicola jeungdonensis TaxID=709343 RepID=A0ABV5J5V6_9BACT|nr:carboxypeptidase-like regulatory domain-containing protein [Echinicola jeungdonensis]MDN3670945.1 carboxypeptidase-like regulatory domain-containing protein [Echinicola jeungdonensis]
MKTFFSIGCLPVILLSIFLSFFTDNVIAQTSISGSVKDGENNEPLIGVNIQVKGTIIGTTTDLDGNFLLEINQSPPLTLIFSMVGYAKEEIGISSAETKNLNVQLQEQTLLGQEVVVSASRVEESILTSPISIEKMDILSIRENASDTYYKSIANLKGVDITSSSINFQILNSRGFNSTGNIRFVQLIDGMDTQAPALNFPIGNLNGPSELDVESVEFIPGASSALYGPNAFNGILLVTSKSPFEYQGLSAYYKQGMNHFNSNAEEPTGAPRPMYEGSIRYAKAFNNKWAFKINGTFMRATDWYGTDKTDLNISSQGNLPFNPGANRVHVFGDEVSSNIGLLRNLSTIQQQAEALGLSAYVSSIPDQVVSRTGYDERYLVDYNAANYKISGSLNYRLNDFLELSYSLNFGSGTSVYTGAQRYSLKNFAITQHKLELKGDNFFLRGYTTRDNSGDSYIADITGVNINSIWKDNSTWFGEYTLAYMGALAQQGVPGGEFGSTTQQAAAHQAARNFADQGRILPGTPEFEEAQASVRSDFIPTGSLFNEKSKMYLAEGQYNFKEEIPFLDMQIGATYRLYDLNSNGTVYADVKGNDITITEYGGFVQASKQLLNEKLKLMGSIRYDKNENFEGQFSPRVSAVISQGNSNIRMSYQTGFRMPDTQGQHIDLNVVSMRLLGGLPYYRNKYDIFNNAFSLASANEYAAAVGAGASPVSPEATSLLKPVNSLPELRPEKVKAVEIGYRGLLADSRLLIDVAYYYSLYDNFITQTAVRKAPGPVYPNPINMEQLAINAVNAPSLLTPVTTIGEENTFSTYTNIEGDNVKANGATLGVTYNLPKNFTLSGNYNYNKLLSDIQEGFLNDFNTPEHKINLSFTNRKLTENLGFNISYRFQSDFRWESSFAQGKVPSIQNLDAQLSIRYPDSKTKLKIGGANILNNRYFYNFGGPLTGAIYYMSITFDELLN